MRQTRAAILAPSLVALAAFACTLVERPDVALPPPEHPPTAEHREVQRGHELYHESCASCHGVSGIGDGPMVPDLRHVPTDLTRIAARRNGVFPDHEIHEIVDGRRRIRGHGSAEMPVWGRRFSHHSDEDELRIRAQILEIVGYLKSIQVSE